uniref:Uncharacterized protein n=1 Tax=Arundo donax TaxID=35708 RepID=A0A0A9EXJ7_ARUDO
MLMPLKQNHSSFHVVQDSLCSIYHKKYIPHPSSKRTHHLLLRK